MQTELSHEAQALNEEAADEIARLDSLATLAPPSAGLVLGILALCELTAPNRQSLLALVAAEADQLHDAAIPEPALLWRSLLLEEERRARGGAPLSITRFTPVVPGLATYRNRGHLEAIWRESGRGRAVLVRALDSSAWFPERGELDEPAELAEDAKKGVASAGEVTAALLLCAGGRTDRVRLLPFMEAADEARAPAIAAWRAGDPEPWARLGLAAAAHRARALREGVRAMTAQEEFEREVIAEMARAGITAGRALEVLRRGLVTTMPALSEDLAISRPAAAAALERLVGAGIAQEVTARARDRVYAYRPALAIAEGALAS